MQLNGLDWVLLGIGLFCVGRGILRGAISQVFGIAGVLAGFVLASHYYESLSVQLSEAFPRLIGPQAVSFVLLFFLAWFCLAIVGFGISKLLQKSDSAFLTGFGAPPWASQGPGFGGDSDFRSDLFPFTSE
jgi:membrane protein required for colicin V production